MATQPLLTYYDYMKTDDDDRYELIDGVLMDVAPRTMPHQGCLSRLFVRVYGFVEENGLGIAFPPRTDVVFSKYDVVQPDISFISQDRRHIIGELNIKGAPDLIIEITTPETEYLDRNTKRQLYGFHGVKEYWIADPAQKRVSVLRAQNGIMEFRREYGITDALTSPTLKHLTIPISQLFDNMYDSLPLA